MPTQRARAVSVLSIRGDLHQLPSAVLLQWSRAVWSDGTWQPIAARLVADALPAYKNIAESSLGGLHGPRAVAQEPGW